MTLAAVIPYDNGHVFLRTNLKICHIFELSDVIAKMKSGEFFGSFC